MVMKEAATSPTGIVSPRMTITRTNTEEAAKEDMKGAMKGVTTEAKIRATKEATNATAEDKNDS